MLVSVCLWFACGPIYINIWASMEYMWPSLLCRYMMVILFFHTMWLRVLCFWLIKPGAWNVLSHESPSLAVLVWGCWTGLITTDTSASCLSCWAWVHSTSWRRTASCPSPLTTSDTCPTRSSEPCCVSMRFHRGQISSVVLFYLFSVTLFNTIHAHRVYDVWRESVEWDSVLKRHHGTPILSILSASDMIDLDLKHSVLASLTWSSLGFPWTS